MPSGRTGGALAAAAMLLLCVGLIRTAGRGSFGGQREAGNAASVSESVNLFVQAAETAFAGDTFSAATISELEGIGQRISGWPESSQSQDDELEAVMQNLMEAFEQADHAAEGALG